MNGKFAVDRKFLPMLVTMVLFVALYLYGVTQYRGFASPQVFFNLLIDNAFLLITSIGMTFVILSGGIDLSVGAVIAFTTVLSAYLLENVGLDPALVVLLVLLFGVTLGAVMGSIFHFCHAGGYVLRPRHVLCAEHRRHHHHQSCLPGSSTFSHPDL
jgi:simple sugar transport system permease protein